MMYAKLVIDIKSDNLCDTFDYIVPSDMEDFIGIGSRVNVEFGRQIVLAYVIGLSDTTSFKGTLKEIKEVLDYDQELTLEQIDLAKFISDTYFVSMASVLDLMIPSFLKSQKRKYLVISDYDKLNPSLQILFKGKKRLPMSKDFEEYYPLIQNEIREKNISLDYNWYTYGKGLKIRRYYVNEDVVPILRSEKRRNIYEYIKNHPLVSEDDIIAYLDCTYNIIREMCKDESIKYHEVFEKEIHDEDLENKSPYKFSFNDNQLIKKYEASKNKLFLLHSNRGEFKANFYIKIIEECKRENKCVLIASPSIFLEEEITMFLKRYLRGYKIYGISSKNSKKERYEVFMNAKYDNLDVLVCTINGIFTPLNNIGAIIVIDEENNNYIMDNYPYYDSVYVLEQRARMHNAKFILSSSSPSIDTYYDALNSKYEILQSIDYKNNIIAIDMNENLSSSSLISDALRQKMNSVLSQNGQVMLLVNSKAYANSLRCRKCGKVLKCPKCNLALTLYKEKDYAKCNYCDYKVYNFDTCACGAKDMISMSYGEERLVEELKEMFTNKRILEINADMLKTQDDYNNAINSIEEGLVDIIVGTSILTKTIKADNIKLSAIINMDSMLNSNNHRANEYAFNYIIKASSTSDLIIQTYTKDSNIIRHAMMYDYLDYYNEELEMREIGMYDPFQEINKITINGEYNSIYHFANYYKKIFNGLNLGTILGPGYDYKIKCVKLILKHNNYEKVIKILKDSLDHFKNERVNVNFERCPKYL